MASRNTAIQPVVSRASLKNSGFCNSFCIIDTAQDTNGPAACQETRQKPRLHLKRLQMVFQSCERSAWPNATLWRAPRQAAQDCVPCGGRCVYATRPASGAYQTSCLSGWPEGGRPE